MVYFLNLLYRKTLASTLFGIFLMALVALYVALGSGIPELREYFEMHELQFFSAWPLKLLMVLLVSNLIIVSVQKIPFTPPRYGVWMVHAGIILLIYGMAWYYTFKIEGDIRIMQGQTVSHYYVKGDRALYMRLNNVPLDWVELPSLPRFKVYSEAEGNQHKLDRADLRGIVPTMNVVDADRRTRLRRPLVEELNLPGTLRFDVLEYYPYASIGTTASADAENGSTAIELSAINARGQQVPSQWLVAADPSRAGLEDPVARIEHRHVTHAEQDRLIAAAMKTHRLQISVGDHQHDVFVEPGAAYTIGNSGWRIEVETYDPAWLTMQRETVQLLTFMVTTPEGSQFRRQVIPGREMPTDWKLNVPGAGPMGERQSAPLDDRFVTTYTVEDADRLLPLNAAHLVVLLTTDDDESLTVISTGVDEQATIARMPNGSGELHLHGTEPGSRIFVARHDGVRVQNSITVTPPEQRERDEAGVFQVVMVRATFERTVPVGPAWHTVMQVRLPDEVQDIPVPFTPWAADTAWRQGHVQLSGTELRLQLQLSNTRALLPARVTLDAFELEHYMGETVETARMFRDFKSKITLQEILDVDPRTGLPQMADPVKADVHMNNPVYFGGITGGQWTLFQSAWDPEGQRFTVLGVGNRPGIWIMLTGCVIMVVGLLYAFYIKPIIIARMKARALRDAAGRSVAPHEPRGSLVGQPQALAGE